MFYCLDTNIIVDLFRGDKKIKSKIEECIKEGRNVATTIINVAELYKGVYLSDKQQENLQLIEQFINTIEILRFEEDASRIFGKNYAKLKKIGEQTQEIDLIIASIVEASNAVLITRNTKDFRKIDSLKIIEW